MTRIEVQLAAACLVAAEVVTQDRIVRAGGKMDPIDVKGRCALWEEALQGILALDPYQKDYVRGGGGVKLSWEIWAYNAEVANANPEERPSLPFTCWDMCYTIRVEGRRIGVSAAGEEGSDLGKGSYSLRGEGDISPWCPGLEGARGDFETPHIYRHRKALESVLKDCGWGLDVVASAARRRD